MSCRTMSDAANAPPIVAEQPPADPVVATIRSKLTDPTLHKGASSDDLAALQSFYTSTMAPCFGYWLGLYGQGPGHH